MWALLARRCVPSAAAVKGFEPLPFGSGAAGAPEGIRTPDLCLRRAALYPAELRALRLVSLAEFRSEGNALGRKPGHPSGQSGLGGSTRACRSLPPQLSRL